ncbi:hypothetical protein Tco_0420755, partial [Tanacetum coccineum]
EVLEAKTVKVLKVGTEHNAADALTKVVPGLKLQHCLELLNVDYAKDPDKGRSITGYAFLVHVCVVSWKATLQHVVALSTTEAEYMALTEAVKEATIWLKGLLEELGVELNTVLEAKTVKVLKVDTEHNDADALTKVVPGLKLQHCLELLNVGVG